MYRYSIAGQRLIRTSFTHNLWVSVNTRIASLIIQVFIDELLGIYQCSTD